MINEREEFQAFITFPDYSANSKRDTHYLGRFTYDMLLDFRGMARVLTILARGYLWETEKPDLERAGKALCAWCSVPDKKKAGPREDWQEPTDYAHLYGEFPELVNEAGEGWFLQHVRNVTQFVERNPKVVLKAALDACDPLSKTAFRDAWRKKVRQYQVPLYAEKTKGSWILRFDDILAEALEQGPLRDSSISLPENVEEMLSQATPRGVPDKVLPTLARYYLANKPVDSDWVVLPVTNFDAYFGSTAFSKKWLADLPEDIVIRESSSGVSRFKIVL